MFAVSAKLDYGLILLRELALKYPDRRISLRSVSAKHGLPYHYLAQIVIPLKKAGIVRSYEGLRGGYVLARPPHSITLQELSAILSGYKRSDHCQLDGHGVCKREKGCSISDWWSRFDDRFQSLLKNTTLADLT